MSEGRVWEYGDDVNTGVIFPGKPRTCRWSRPVIDFASEAGAIDFEHGVVLHDAAEYRFPALPPEVLAILEDGGLIPHVKKVLAG